MFSFLLVPTSDQLKNFSSLSWFVVVVVGPTKQNSPAQLIPCQIRCHIDKQFVCWQMDRHWFGWFVGYWVKGNLIASVVDNQASLATEQCSVTLPPLVGCRWFSSLTLVHSIVELIERTPAWHANSCSVLLLLCYYRSPHSPTQSPEQDEEEEFRGWIVSSSSHYSIVRYLLTSTYPCVWFVCLGFVNRLNVNAKGAEKTGEPPQEAP